ncbi:MAG: DnaB-like helicase N-terminal domain-containing protein [Bacteroidota bacterium]
MSEVQQKQEWHTGWRQHMRELEELVIGTVLSSNSYAQVCHILNEKHFRDSKGFSLRKVWKVCKLLFEEQKPIDVNSVYIKYSQTNGSEADVAYKLCRLTQKVYSDAHLSYHAFVLLELSIRDYFWLKLMQLLSVSEQEEAYEWAVIYKKMLSQIVDPNCDVLQLALTIPDYLESSGLTEEAEQLRAISEGINSRALQIKKPWQHTFLMNNIQRYMMGRVQDYSTRELSSLLIRWLDDICKDGKAHMKYFLELEQLHKEHG